MNADVQTCPGCGQGDFWLVEIGRYLGTGTCCSIECLRLEQLRLSDGDRGKNRRIQADQLEQVPSGGQLDDLHEWPHPQNE